MSPSALTLEMFAEHVRYTNPFDENRVTQTDSLTSDIPQIHADAFDELTSRAKKAAQSKEMGCGVVVTGSPGVGKSHLLARFGDWARKEKYPFVYLLNLQAGPNDILRTILRTSISILTKGMTKSPGQTRLYRLVSATLNHALAAQGINQQVDLPTAHEAYKVILTRLKGDASIYNVLWLLFDDVLHQTRGHRPNGRADLAKRWLSGGYLDPDEARQLDLKVSAVSDDGCSLDVEQMKEVLRALCIDADAARLMIQDRLQQSFARFDSLTEVCEQRQRDPLFPLGKVWARQTLFDISGEQKSDLRPRTIINQAGLGWDQQSRELQKQGVADWLHSWSENGRDSLKALDVNDVDIIQLIDAKVSAKIEEHRQSRMLRPEELPVDAGNVVGLLTTLLNICGKAGSPFRTEQYGRFGGIVVSSAKSRKKPAFQLVVEHFPDAPQGIRRTIGVTVADASSGLVATNMLKRILAEFEGPNGPDRAILIVDDREPLQLAGAGQSCLEKLKSLNSRFSIEILGFEQYATLDAFEAVVGLARSGDLEVVLPDGISRPIHETEVYESNHRNQHYLEPSVLCQLLGKCTHTEIPNWAGVDLQRVLEATYAQLAMNIGLTTLQLASWWMEHQIPKPDVSHHAAVHNMFKEVVLKLHAEGKVFATALNDYYLVQPTGKLTEAAAK